MLNSQNTKTSVFSFQVRVMVVFTFHISLGKFTSITSKLTCGIKLIGTTLLGLI